MPEPPYCEIVFAIPVQPKATAPEWGLVSRLCAATVQSLLAQSNSSFQIIVVGNDPPDSLPLDHRVHFHSIDTPIPNTYGECINDIRLKVKAGLKRAKAFLPNYFMRVDGDDFLHRDFVHHLVSAQNPNGLFISRGYTWDLSSNRFFRQPDFDMNCGTAHAIRLREGDFPQGLDTPDSNWLACIWQHQNINRYL